MPDLAHAIFLSSDETRTQASVQDALRDGARQLPVPLDGVTDLAISLLTVLDPPWHTVGFDAIVDLLSDLDWMPSRHGYVLRATGLDMLRRTSDAC